VSRRLTRRLTRIRNDWRLVMQQWIAGYRVTSERSDKSISFGVVIIGGESLEDALRKAERNLRERYEVPRGRVELHRPEPYTAPGE
jgi:hypothetical protein